MGRVHLYIRITRREAAFSCGGESGSTEHDGTFAGIVAAIKRLQEEAGYYDTCSTTIEDV
jgi:hypothetical protein